MPDNENQPGETPAPAPAATSTPPAPETGPDGQPFDAARAMSTIEALRAEIKGLKGTSKERDELAAKVKEFEQAQLSETERVTAQLKDAEAKAADLESRYQTALIRSAVEREASKAGAVDPEVVYALIDRTAVTLAEDGNVSGADKAVEALLKAKPYLVATGDQSATTTRTATRSIPSTPKPAGAPSREDRVKQAEKELAASRRYTL